MTTKAKVVSRIKATEIQVEAFVANLNDFLDLNLRRILKGLKADDITAKTAAQVLGSLRGALVEAGLEERVAGLYDLYGNQLQQVASELASISGLSTDAVFGGADKALIENLVTFDVSRVASRLDYGVDELRSKLMRTFIAGTPLDLDGTIEAEDGRILTDLSTETNTMLHSFNNSVRVSKASDLGFELFQYVGPDDKVTRDFCKRILHRLPSIHKLEEIKNMSNGTDLDVLTYGGGYNCRHTWYPITEESARELGYG